MEVDKKSLGIRIKNIRVHKCNMVMQEFADKIGSGKSNVSRWERGENVPNDLTLKKIAELGEISFEELLYGDFEARIKKILLDKNEVNEKIIVFVIDYFVNIDNKYPTKEDIFNKYDEIFEIIDSSAKEQANQFVNQIFLGVNIRLAKEELLKCLENPSKNEKIEYINFAIEKLNEAANDYETLFNTTIDEVYEKNIIKES